MHKFKSQICYHSTTVYKGHLCITAVFVCPKSDHYTQAPLAVHIHNCVEVHSVSILLQDNKHTCYGDVFAKAVDLIVRNYDQVIAVGINCTPPQFVLVS